MPDITLGSFSDSASDFLNPPPLAGEDRRDHSRVPSHPSFAQHYLRVKTIGDRGQVWESWLAPPLYDPNDSDDAEDEYRDKYR